MVWEPGELPTHTQGNKKRIGRAHIFTLFILHYYSQGAMPGILFPIILFSFTLGSIFPTVLACTFLLHFISIFPLQFTRCHARDPFSHHFIFRHHRDPFSRYIRHALLSFIFHLSRQDERIPIGFNTCPLLHAGVSTPFAPNQGVKKKK